MSKTLPSNNKGELRLPYFLLIILCGGEMPNYETFNRKTVTPIVSRHASNNVTRDIFGGQSFKLKKCECCGEFKLYSDFYLKPGFQDLHRYSICEMHLRSDCVACFDYKNKYEYNLGSRPKPEITATLEEFLKLLENEAV